ncbi:RHS repeat-associated core domain-containing protein [Nannocystis sp. RBIL2]|uniref:RHS repeat domain-containing protein n=1 Tax=Nannocystis sp. RBIL2 TaxID=2996788 RepID=UPI002270D86B|nr:RHS repeat-associated core domain-containing protein [Nannocystis sp. RBIL2]MCY1066913.1 RHS repeat-associated core domain-containing protein [Nannocystis sp. RBIL2]
MVIKTAVMGKVSGSDGDTLTDPTMEIEYDLTVIPAVVHTIVRENHGAGNLAFQHSYAYSGGLGQVVLQKVQAEPGLAPKRNGNGDLEFDGGELVFEDTTPNPRWVGNGRVIVDNKGNPVKQYEPFFDSSPAYTDEQELVEWGVTPFIHYDPLGRMIRTDLPDGTFLKVSFTPWQQVTHDANDNVLASDWYAERDALVGGTPHNDGEKYAALHAEPHDSTPTTTLLDNLGRPFLVIADNGLDENDVPQKFETRTKLDIEGNTLEVKDARNNVAETNTFAPGGLQLKTHSVDAGTRLALPNVLGNPLRAWDNRQNVRRWTYDVLNRPTHAYLKHAADPEVLQQRIVYGESLGVSADDTNHLGQVYRVYDSAGVLTSLAYDFKGNLLATERGLAEAYKTTPDWIDLATETDPALIHAAAAPLLEGETFTTSWTYDALSRVRTQTTPDASVTTQTFGLGGMLQSVAVNVRGALTATDIVTNIDYNARGQRLLIEYGNGSTTDYEYDPNNFRVTRIHTERPPTYAGLRTVQDLRYHYDPSGNIAQIRDQAQQGVFFDNAYVDPTQKFRYDPTYRLIEATGREHDALAKPTPAGFTPIAHPQDTQAQRLYKQLYTYDSVGNIREMAHRVIVGNVEQVAWRRGYLYATAGNRLQYTNVPGDDVDDPQSYTGFYDYDEHGNMITIAQIPGGLTWDDDDRLQSTSHVGGGTVYYVYDGAGQRVRKVTVNLSGTTSKQRLYFGGWETYREHKNINTTNDLDLERETLHVHDDHGRVCLIETKTVDAGAPVVTPANIARYQYSNHLGTANLELDDVAEVISYEEFHPYGTSSYRAANSAIEVSAKRYRYTGQERDEETGLAYHGARYYAPWLARWTAADPIGLGDGVNRYWYTHDNPATLKDPSRLLKKSRPAQIGMSIRTEHGRIRPRRALLDDEWGGFAGSVAIFQRPASGTAPPDPEQEVPKGLVDRGEPNQVRLTGTTAAPGLGLQVSFGRPSRARSSDKSGAEVGAPAFGAMRGPKFLWRALPMRDAGWRTGGLTTVRPLTAPLSPKTMTFEHMRWYKAEKSPILHGHGTNRISLAGTPANAQSLVDVGRAPAGVVRVNVPHAEALGVEFRGPEKIHADLSTVRADYQAQVDAAPSKTKADRPLRTMAAADKALEYADKWKETHAIEHVPPKALSEVRSLRAERSGEAARHVARGLGPPLLAFGAYSSVMRIASAPTEQRGDVIMEESSAWVGGLAGAEVGAQLGAAGGPWGCLRVA